MRHDREVDPDDLVHGIDPEQRPGPPLRGGRRSAAGGSRCSTSTSRSTGRSSQTPRMLRYTAAAV
jgi:hypothetical protein